MCGFNQALEIRVKQTIRQTNPILLTAGVALSLVGRRKQQQARSNPMSGNVRQCESSVWNILLFNNSYLLSIHVMLRSSGWSRITPKCNSLSLPDGKKLKVKSGTQIIDRCWQHLRSHLKYAPRFPGNDVMIRKIRSAQWVYWQKGKSLWTATGAMMSFLCKWTVIATVRVSGQVPVLSLTDILSAQRLCGDWFKTKAHCTSTQEFCFAFGSRATKPFPIKHDSRCSGSIGSENQKSKNPKVSTPLGQPRNFWIFWFS